MEKINTLIVGAGQAGIAMSEHLSANGVEHLILEKHRIAEQWRTGRWDSLVANGPAWHDRFPSLDFAGFNGADFVPKESVADYFVSYAEHINAPIRCGVDVTQVTKQRGQRGFNVCTSVGDFEAEQVVAATGPFQCPVIPPLVPTTEGVTQMHSNAYRNPEQLSAGAVLVIGAGSSGGQIADELLRSGKKTYLSVGPHDRPPRSYRGHDFVWWLGVLGKWDAVTPPACSEHVTISVSGARGGHTVDFRKLAERGMTLLGRTTRYIEGQLQFDKDLADNINNGDANYLSVLAEADAYIENNGLDLPLEPEAHVIGPDPACVSNPLLSLNLAEAGISTIIWATGYAHDYSWLNVNALDSNGSPNHQRGVSTESGIYFLGLPWQSRRGSSFIWGVWHDAKFIADHIVTQQKYKDHHQASLR